MSPSPSQRRALERYDANQRDKGYIKVRMWVPEELHAWFLEMAQAAREWHDGGDAIVVPPLPAQCVARRKPPARRRRRPTALPSHGPKR